MSTNLVPAKKRTIVKATKRSRLVAVDFQVSFMGGFNRYEFCFDSHSERTPDAYPYGYDPYFIKGHKRDTEGCSAYYNDRMYQNRYELYHEIRRSMDVPHGDYFWRHISLEKASEFISRFEGKPYEVTAIGEGCNVSNGYPYWIIWFKPADQLLLEA